LKMESLHSIQMFGATHPVTMCSSQKINSSTTKRWNSETYSTGWKGFLLRSLWDCSTFIVCVGDSTLTP
jgi:hypothetical protein